MRVRDGLRPARRSASQPEFPVSGLAADVAECARHSQKLEGLRFSLPSALSVRACEPSELDEPGFVGVQFQPEPGKPFLQVVQEAHRFPPVLEADDEVIRIADENHVAFHLPLAP